MSYSASNQIFTLRALWSCFVLVLLSALSACGGNTNDAGNLGVQDCASDPNTAYTEACISSTREKRIQAALLEGDSSLLQPGDASALITKTYTDYQALKNSQNDLIARIYAGQSTKFELIKFSYMMQPAFLNTDYVFPLVVGDKGNVLASISTLGGGRIAGYGYDILAGFDLTKTRVKGLDSNGREITARQPDHQPVFKRVIAWLVSGDPAKDVSPANAGGFNIAWASLPTSKTNPVLYTTTDTQEKVYEPYAVEGLRQLNIAFNNLPCDPLSAPLADCAAKAQLVVIGAIDSSKAAQLPTQLARIQEMVAARIPILYMNVHPNRGEANNFADGTPDEDHPRMDALGFASGVSPNKSNYWLLDWVANEITPDAMKKRNDFLNIDFLNRIASGNFNQNYDWSNCGADGDCDLDDAYRNEIMTPVKKIQALLNSMDSKGQSLYDKTLHYQALKMLVLWADTYRQSISYPLDKKKDPVKFQLAYIADSLVSYLREKGMGQKDLGNFLEPSAKDAPVSESFESVDVTLFGNGGFTSTGRFVVPGKRFQIRLASPPAGTFKFKINLMSPDSTKQYESPVDANGKDAPANGYRRPESLMSPEFALTTQAVSIVSPYGGTLQLIFSGTSANKVTLQIQGAARAPFYDTTQGKPDVNAFYRDMTSNKLSWMEIKTPGMEIHSPSKMAINALLPAADESDAVRAKYPNSSRPYYRLAEGILMDKYLDETNKYVIEDAYRLAGLRAGGLELNQRVSHFCESRQWDCTNEKIHVLPQSQHFFIDIRSAAGSMSSGQPIHSSEAFNPRGWGESHELGHNLASFKVYDRISTEVSNNIFPLHKKWRMRMNLTRQAISYANELSDTNIVFNALKNAYKSSGDKVANAKNAVWTTPNSTNRGMLYFYLQWPLMYADIIKAQNPGISEADAIDAGWDIYTLMYLNLRQVNATALADWPTVKEKLGFGTYTVKPATSTAPVGGAYPHHDYLLVVLSLITGKNQTPLFDFWGVQTSEMGRGQAAALKDSNGRPLAMQPVKFYATRCSDDFRGYISVDMTQSDPNFLWASEFSSSVSDPQGEAKRALHNNYCLGQQD